jgi:hypothetical protein
VERTQKSGLSIMRQVQWVIGSSTLAGALLALFVDPLFAIIPAVTGAGLVVNGATGWCGLSIFLSKMPWNRVAQPARASQAAKA